jgi:hypothetical protein
MSIRYVDSAIDFQVRIINNGYVVVIGDTEMHFPTDKELVGYLNKKVPMVLNRISEDPEPRG